MQSKSDTNTQPNGHTVIQTPSLTITLNTQSHKHAISRQHKQSAPRSHKQAVVKETLAHRIEIQTITSN